MRILTLADQARHAAALVSFTQNPPYVHGFSKDEEAKLWGLIESILVPSLVGRLVQEVRLTYSAGGDPEAQERLSAVAVLASGACDMFTAAKIQYMLDRMMDFHPLRDDPSPDRSGARRLHRLFERELKKLDPGFTISLEPQFHAINGRPGHMKAKYLHTLVILEPKSTEPNRGPRRYRKEAQWNRELDTPPSE